MDVYAECINCHKIFVAERIEKVELEDRSKTIYYPSDGEHHPHKNLVRICKRCKRLVDSVERTM